MEEGGGPSELEQFVHDRIADRSSRIEELLAQGAQLLAQSRQVMHDLDVALRATQR